jgi:hypothetical protein
MQNGPAQTSKLLHLLFGVLRIFGTLMQAAPFTVLEHLEHYSGTIYKMECTRCSGTVLSLLYMRATMHYYIN